MNTVREELLHFFNHNKDISTKIVEKVTDTQQLRKEMQEVKKLARERAKARLDQTNRLSHTHASACMSALNSCGVS